MIKEFNSWWEKHLGKINNLWLLITFILVAVFIIILFLGMIYYIELVGFNVWGILIMAAGVIMIFAGLGFMFGISTVMEARIKSK